MASSEIHSFQLDNGMQVILWPRTDGDSITSVLSVGVGSRHEDESNWGIAHFLEHLLFYKSDLKKEELQGLYNNAYTWIYDTAYVYEAQPNQLETILENTRRKVFHPELGPEEVEKERGIITEEWKMYWDEPASYADFLMTKLMFEGHPMEIDTIGTYESIQKLSLPQFQERVDNYYHPENSVLVVVGQLEVDEARRVIEGMFTESGGKAPEFVLYEDQQQEPKIKFGQRETEQVVAKLGFKTPGIAPNHASKEKIAQVWVLETLLGMLAQGKASLFQHHLIDEKGLVSDFGVTTFWNYEVSNFEVELTAAPEKTLPALQEVRRILQAIKAGEHAGEIERAKHIYRTSFIFNLEDSSARAGLLARYWHLTRSVFDLGHYLTRIDAVTPEDVARVASKYLVPSNASLAWVGKKEPNSKQLEEILLNLG